MQKNESKWNVFLRDPELADRQGYYGPPDGRYFFGQILHDTLECLNNFTAILKLMASFEKGIPISTFHWFMTQGAIIEPIIAEINSRGRHYGELPASSNEWPYLIQEVGSILDKLPKFVDEFEQLNKPSGKPANDLVAMAIDNLGGVSAINADI
ncbi:MAG: hypothetical protein GY805_18240 [Chloroflexi bacterium]|nr:hypothetical protein [Chloroflexota bacterium]